MRLHPFALGVVLATGCTAGTDDAPATPAPAADAPAAALPGPAAPPTAPGSGSPPAVPDVAVPADFQGRYAANAAACDAPGHESQLDIGPSSLAFHESSGPVTQVDSAGTRMDVTVQLAGEGQVRDARYSFSLSDDGRTLTDTNGGMVRQRCE